MPHVIVKVYPGKSEALKATLAEAVARAVASTLSFGEETVSVAIEEVSRERWPAEVYEKDVLTAGDRLYKASTYKPPT